MMNFFQSGLGAYRWGTGEASSAFDADAQAFFDRITTLGRTLPTTQNQSAISEFIENIKIIPAGKSVSAFSITDVLMIPAIDGAINIGFINIKNLTHEGVITVSPIHIKRQGVTGNNSNMYVDLDWAPSSGVNYTQNNAGVVVYIQNSFATTSQTSQILGAADAGTTNGVNFNPYEVTVNAARYRVNQSTVRSVANTNAEGLWFIDRQDANNISLKVGRSSVTTIDTASVASTGRTSVKVKLLALDTAGTIGSYSSRTAGLIMFGASYSGYEDTINNAWNTYLSRLVDVDDEVFPAVSISGRTHIHAFGDSYPVGFSASPSSNSFVEQFKTTHGFSTITNAAEAGRGWTSMAIAAEAAGFTQAVTAVILAGGLNNARRGADDAKTLNTVEAGLRTVLLRCIQNARTASGAAAVTHGGTITAFDASAAYGVFGTGAIPGNVGTQAANGNAGSWSWGFTGTAFGIQFIASDGVTTSYGSVTVKIDGNLVATINLNDWYDGLTVGGVSPDGTRGPLAYTYHGLSSGAHTILVEKVGTTGLVPLDFFATIVAPAAAPVVYMFEIPYITSYGDTLSAGATSWSITAADNMTARIKTVAAEYVALGYPFTVVPVNSYYEVNKGIDVDGLHPNNNGHSGATGSYLQAMNSRTL